MFTLFQITLRQFVWLSSREYLDVFEKNQKSQRGTVRRVSGDPEFGAGWRVSGHGSMRVGWQMQATVRRVHSRSHERLLLLS